MVPPTVRGVHALRRFALFVLIALSALALFWPLVLGARAAGAAFAYPLPAGGVLAVSPTSLTTCRQCTVTAGNESPTRSLTWSASSHGIPGVTLKPAHGMLPPQGRVSVSITVPSTVTCPANDTITFSGPTNSVNVSWSCLATPTPTLTPSLTPTTTATPRLTPPPATPAPTSKPTTAPTPSLTASASPTPTSDSPGPTPTATSVPDSVQQTDGNPPPSSGSQDSAVPSILLGVATLLLALCAIMLDPRPPAKASLPQRLLSLMLPAWFLRKLDRPR